MNKGTLQAFAAGIILSTAVVAGYEHWFGSDQDQTISNKEAASLLRQNGYTVTAGAKEAEGKQTAKEAAKIPEKQPTEQSEEASAKEGDSQKESQTDAEETNPVSYKLSIRSGMTSIYISALLEKEGIIEEATALEKYLEQNDLNKEIQIGEYELTNKMSIQQVAKTITK